MEYQGIITGVGEDNKITPEIDAILYNYILGKNAIIDGLTIQSGTLKAGECVLLGYRGVIDEDISNIGTNTYIYGKFILHLPDSTVADEFYIETSNNTHTVPTSITTAGTYYLLLYTYTNGAYVANVDTLHNYPLKAFQSDESQNLGAHGTIDGSATCKTQNLNDNSTKMATTAYVHNQIQEEINATDENIAVSKSSSGYIYDNTLTGTITLNHKAGYVIGNASNFTGRMTSSGSISGVLGTTNFKPTTTKYGVIKLDGTATGEGSTSALKTYYRISIGINGQISLVDNIRAEGIVDTITGATIYLGYSVN